MVEKSGEEWPVNQIYKVKVSSLKEKDVKAMGTKIRNNKAIYNRSAPGKSSDFTDSSHFTNWLTKARELEGPFSAMMNSGSIVNQAAAVQNMKNHVSLMGKCLVNHRCRGLFFEHTKT